MLARAIGFAVTGGDAENATVADGDGNVVLNGYGHPVLDEDIVRRNGEKGLRDGKGRIAVLIAVWLRRPDETGRRTIPNVGLATVGPSGRVRTRPMTEAEIANLLNQEGFAAFVHSPVPEEAVPYVEKLEEIQRLRNAGVARHRWEDMLDELLRELGLPRSRSTRERLHKSAAPK